METSASPKDVKKRPTSRGSQIYPDESNENSKNFEMIAMNDVPNGEPSNRRNGPSDRDLVVNKPDDDEFNDDEDDEEDDDEGSENFFSRIKNSITEFLVNIWKLEMTKFILVGGLVGLYLIYFGFAMWLNNPFGYLSVPDRNNTLDEYVFANNRGLALLVLTCIVFLVAFWDMALVDVATKYLNFKLNERSFVKRFGSWILVGLVLIACIVYVAVTLEDAYNLVSVSGILCFILVSFILSSKKSKINWHILIVGIEIQFILGVLLIRTEFGYKLFKFLSDQVTTFLEYTDAGSSLVFGEKYTDHIFAFKSIPVIIFFSAVINTFFYLGAVQYVTLKVSWVLNKLMGTSPTESLNATANIFIGQTEAPLLIKPFMPKMTQSELFSLMTAGYATVAGSVFAAYVNFGVPANHLIVASIMAAPGALAISKTIFPETRKTKADWDAIKNMPRGDAKNIFEAISIGASNVIGAVAGIISNLIAFVAIFAFLDKLVAWFFSMLSLENFGITSIIQYLFFPFALLMGVSIEDCANVSKLIGIKIFVNEFVAYAELGKTISFRENITESNLYDFYRNGTYPIPNDIFMIWNDRSIVISTYALCGFANFGSVGIVIGGLSTLAPRRLKVFSRYAVKAMIAGNITNFCTACIAGLLYQKL